MKKRIWIGIIIVILAIIGWWMGRSPSVGKIKVGEVGEVKVKEVEWIGYQKNGFRFEYPDSLVVNEEDERRVVLLGGMGRSTQVVVAKRVWSESLAEIPDIKMRQLDKIKYELMGEVEGWVCYKKLEGYERVCWRKNEEEVISVALTANSNDVALIDDFARMVGSATTR